MWAEQCREEGRNLEINKWGEKALTDLSYLI